MLVLSTTVKNRTSPDPDNPGSIIVHDPEVSAGILTTADEVETLENQIKAKDHRVLGTQTWDLDIDPKTGIPSIGGQRA